MSASPLRLQCAIALGLFGWSANLLAQEPPPIPPGPMLDGGHLTLHSNALNLDLLRYSGTVAQLTPTTQPSFDFTPGDMLRERSADTFYHLGDLDLRVRTAGSNTWQTLATAFRRRPVTVLTQTPTVFRADLTASVPNDVGLKVIRTWAVTPDGTLQLSFTLTNIGNAAIELGGVGIPMVFNNILIHRTLEQAYQHCSFYDPYIGNDAGYVQVSPLKGTGPVLLVAPLGHTPLEAWKPILDKRDPTTHLGNLGNDPTPRWTTFEGSFDWVVHSRAYAETDWHNPEGDQAHQQPEQWNTPTSETLAPGASVTFGLQFFTAPGLRAIEPTLAAHNRPVAVGIPGYILPQDQQGRLFLRYNHKVRSLTPVPADGLTVHDDGMLPSGLHAYTLQGRTWGRSRLDITYDDGTVQTIAYRTLKPATDVVADLGRFSFHEQWFEQPNDPFGRSPSIISYDDSTHAQVTQEPRAWIAGLSDEAGAGAWLAAAMKEGIAPTQDEVAQLERFVDGVLWGHLQVSEGEHKFGVHKSLFFYDPKVLPSYPYLKDVDWHSWTSWNQEAAADLGRAYNYPHVAAAYWSLYRIARNTQGLTEKHPWQWYLTQAYETTMAMRSQAPYYTQFGLMEGDVFVQILADLRAEGMSEKADTLEAWMREREAHWRTETYPFGSEMPWDSTGQEEVYAWSRHFGDAEKAQITLDAVLAYTPTLPSWGYNGSARRYWDFVYGGKIERVERQLHHYGSGINAIPLLTAYRDHPEDLYLLRTGYGGMMGPLTNIDQKGFSSAAFHSFPDRMSFDPYTGDYGPNFFGHAFNTGVYLTHDDAMGWLCFGGNLQPAQADKLSFTVLDSTRSRVFLAPFKLWITLDAGHVRSVDLDTKTHTVRLHLEPATANIATVRLRVETSPGSPAFQVTGTHTTDAGATVVPLTSTETVITLQPR